MSFHLSASSVELKDNHKLVCKLRDKQGHEHESQLDLDSYIGNTNGFFEWDGRDFTKSARTVTLCHRSDGPWLEAELYIEDQGFGPKQGIRLADKLENKNGKLAYAG